MWLKSLCLIFALFTIAPLPGRAQDRLSDPPDVSDSREENAATVLRYQNPTGLPGSWDREDGQEVQIEKARWLDENLIAYKPATWVEESTKGVSYQRDGEEALTFVAVHQTPKPAPVYKKVGQDWVDHDYSKVDQPTAQSLNKTVSRDYQNLWHTRAGQYAIWQGDTGGYAASAGDTSKAHDYAVPVGAANDPVLSTGWAGPLGSRNVHVRDYYRRTKSGEYIHVHSYYRSHAGSRKTSSKSTSKSSHSSSHSGRHR